MNRASPDCLYYFTKEGAFGTVGYSSLTKHALWIAQELELLWGDIGK